MSTSSLNLDGFRDPQRIKNLIDAIHAVVADRSINLMEVCGTHTMSIGRYGFRSVMPQGLKLLSGPGCPVCVTANEDIDRAIALSQLENVTIATFGDMMRIPGSYTSLAEQKAQGADIRMVYSPLDALALAQAEPSRHVIFLGAGFETTTPAIAASILEAAELDIDNFSVYCMHKTTPAALRVIAQDPQTRIDGFILPGHVCAITGAEPFAFLEHELNVPGVVTGFEPVDILDGILQLVQMIVQQQPRVINAYQRTVKDGGNRTAQELVERVFEPCEALWRGIGPIPNSGLCIRSEFAHYDASSRFTVDVAPSVEPKGCRCGDVLCGRIMPSACSLFGRTCTPEHPIGPCMVSSEGSCAAHFKYREEA